MDPSEGKQKGNSSFPCEYLLADAAVKINFPALKI
jgi:hypothetical protein